MTEKPDPYAIPLHEIHGALPPVGAVQCGKSNSALTSWRMINTAAPGVTDMNQTRPAVAFYERDIVSSRRDMQDLPLARLRTEDAPGRAPAVQQLVLHHRVSPLIKYILLRDHAERAAKATDRPRIEPTAPVNGNGKAEHKGTLRQVRWLTRTVVKSFLRGIAEPGWRYPEPRYSIDRSAPPVDGGDVCEATTGLPYAPAQPAVRLITREERRALNHGADPFVVPIAQTPHARQTLCRLFGTQLGHALYAFDATPERQLAQHHLKHGDTDEDREAREESTALASLRQRGIDAAAPDSTGEAP